MFNQHAYYLESIQKLANLVEIKAPEKFNRRHTKKLLDGNSFKIIIYDGKGKLITQSQEVIGEQKLVDLLTRDS